MAPPHPTSMIESTLLPFPSLLLSTLFTPPFLLFPPKSHSSRVSLFTTRLSHHNWWVASYRIHNFSVRLVQRWIIHEKQNYIGHEKTETNWIASRWLTSYTCNGYHEDEFEMKRSFCEKCSRRIESLNNKQPCNKAIHSRPRNHITCRTI